MGIGFRFHLGIFPGGGDPIKHYRFARVHIEFRPEHTKAVDAGKEEICVYKAFPDYLG